MNLILDASLLSLFPEANVHACVWELPASIDLAVCNTWLSKAKEHMADSGLTVEKVTEMPEIAAWREAFAKFGVKPSAVRSSLEQLWRRSLKSGPIQTPIALVNLYCCVSIVSHAPMGAYDLTKVEGDIVVRRAGNGETFLGLGEKEPITVEPGVVIYADNGGVLCYAWNNRDAARSGLVNETQRAIFFADAAMESGRKPAHYALELLAEALTAAGGKELQRFVLDKNTAKQALVE